MLASRVIQLKTASQKSGQLDPEQLTHTDKLNAELQSAAKSLGSRCWRAPNVDNVKSPSSEVLFWDTRRLFAQVLHYHLLNRLNLPLMKETSAMMILQEDG